MCEKNLERKVLNLSPNDEKRWIYESPDGGKTIYRRKFGNYDERERI